MLSYQFETSVYNYWLTILCLHIFEKKFEYGIKITIYALPALRAKETTS